MWDAIVVGGGCAGLSAATALIEDGKRVLVLERRPVLGGRASSFRDAVSGEILDNGQHLFLGCYKETWAYLNRIGAAQQLPFTSSFATSMFGPQGEYSRLRTARLPAPFHMATALLRYDAIPLRDRWKMTRVTRDALKPKSDLKEMSVAQWLDRLGQSQVSRERFWDLLVLATLNVQPERAPANLLAIVLRDAFLSSASSSAVGLARVGLSELLGDPAKKLIEARGGEVRLKSSVSRVVFEGARTTGVELEDGSVENASAIILAVPPPPLRTMLRTAPTQLQRELMATEALFSSPILSVHAWTDEPPFEEPFVGLWGTHFHWAFNKSKICQDPSTTHFTLVASAPGNLLHRTRAELTQLAERELRLLSRSRSVRLKRIVAVREMAATWVPPIGAREHRLKHETSIPNLFLAGDWTDTGLPATIEGAVQSGHVAAQACAQTIFSHLNSASLSVRSVP